MARTNRSTNATTPSANVETLDNIDLDDMFADDGDALFDGLDMEFGQMDDLGGGSNRGQGSTSAVAPAKTSTQRLSPQDSQSKSPSLDPDDDADDDDDGPPRTKLNDRRTTKRKAKYQSFLDDTDDDFDQQWQSSSKRTKVSSSGTSNKFTKDSIIKVKGSNNSKKSLKKPLTYDSKLQQSQPTLQISQSKEKNMSLSSSTKLSSTTSISSTKVKINLRATNTGIGLPMPPAPLMMGVMTTRGGGTMTLPSQVAAAGQFGGRNKRTTSGNSTPLGASSFGSLPKTSLPVKSSKLPMMSSRSTDNGAESDPSKRTSKQNNQQNNNDQELQPKSSLASSKLKIKSTSKDSSMSFKTQHSTPGSASAPSTSLKGRRRITTKEFCGLKPSDTTFYPFMPSLPIEPTMKSKKEYGLLDRAHSVFTNYLATSNQDLPNDNSTAIEAHPIYKLLEEAFKDDVKQQWMTEDSETSSTRKMKAGQIFVALSNARKTIRQFDTNSLADDLFSVCSLLQKQHDFLHQNAKNMQRWCKSSFSQEDYLLLYKSSKKSAIFSADEVIVPKTVLESFGRREVKVRIVCEGFKDPTGSKPGLIPSLPVLLPPRFAPPPPLAPSASTARHNHPLLSDHSRLASMGMLPTNKPKKRKSSTTPVPAIKTTSAITKQALIAYSILPPNIKKSPQTTISFATMKPMKRRKCISDLLSKTALEIENEHRKQSNNRRIAIDTNEQSIQNMVNEDISKMQMIHTGGMWKYIDQAGYFKAISESELQQRLSEIRSLTNKPTTRKAVESIYANESATQSGEGNFNTRRRQLTNTTVLDRLHSLLVFENEDNCIEEEGQMDNEDDSVLKELYSCIVDEPQTVNSSSVKGDEYSYETTQNHHVDLSPLTFEERAFLHLRFADLVTQDKVLPELVPQPENTLVDDAQTWNSSKNVAWPELSSSSTNVGKTVNGVKGDHRSTTIESKNKPSTSVQIHDGNDNKCEIDQVVDTMTADFHYRNELNNRRIAFLESAAFASSDFFENDRKARDDYETATIAKCHQLLRKSKAEQKAKSDKTKKISDGLSLPW